MLWVLLTTYIYFLIGMIFATISLILLGVGWGPLPHKYLRLIYHIQEFFPKSYSGSLDGVPWTGLLDKCSNGQLLVRTSSMTSCSSGSTSPTENKFEVLLPPKDVFDVSLELTQAGLEAIVEDDVSGIFGYAPDYAKWELSLDFWNRIRDQPHLRVLFLSLIFFRVFILFPIRLALITSSFGFAGFFCIIACFYSLTNQQKTWIAVVYSRLYTAGTGLVATYHDRENVPKQPGFAVSNHLSPNDIQIIASDVDTTRDYLYTVTGQKHGGIIWAIERLVERLNPALWLERNNPEERKNFTKTVLNEARRAGPVLLFPEGYCTNNTRVLQFRKAAFEDEVAIYPIAIKQNARFGDSFWSEDQFYVYLFRLLTSFASVYEVYYLEPQFREPHETAEMFAQRVQEMICQKIGVRPANFDGSLWYKKVERAKYVQVLQNKCALQLIHLSL